MIKWLGYLLIAVVAILIGLALAGPIGPLPGVRIGGNTVTAPAQWSTIGLPHEVQLKTTGGLLPRVVNIWVVEVDNALYVFGVKDSGWVNGTIKDPDIELRIGDDTFDLLATRLDMVDPGIYQQYLDRYAPDYPDIIAGMPKSDEITDGGVAFRLTGR